MVIKEYHRLPDQAVSVRSRVFMQEQGFVNEFDDIDATAIHLVLFDDAGRALGTCRIYTDPDRPDVRILGRLALLPQARGQHLGRALLRAALTAARRDGGKEMRLHAQCWAQGFYAAEGFAADCPVDEDEGVPHIWMVKAL